MQDNRVIEQPHRCLTCADVMAEDQSFCTEDCQIIYEAELVAQAEAAQMDYDLMAEREMIVDKGVHYGH